jgi:hypothetical protein
MTLVKFQLPTYIGIQRRKRVLPPDPVPAAFLGLHVALHLTLAVLLLIRHRGSDDKIRLERGKMTIRCEGYPRLKAV